MKAIDALLELLGRVGACRDAAVLVNDEELLQWPRGGSQSHEIPKADRKSTSGIKRDMSGVREQLYHACAYPARDNKQTVIFYRLRQAKRHQPGADFLR